MVGDDGTGHGWPLSRARSTELLFVASWTILHPLSHPPSPVLHFSLFSTPHLDHRSLTKGGGGVGRSINFEGSRSIWNMFRRRLTRRFAGVSPGNPLFLWIIPVIVKSGRIDNGKLGLEIFWNEEEGSLCHLLLYEWYFRYNIERVEYWLKFILGFDKFYSEKNLKMICRWNVLRIEIKVVK